MFNPESLVIHKLVVPMPDKDGFVEVSVPNNACLLRFGIQNDQIVIWYEYKQKLIIIPRTANIRVVNTGQEYQFANERMIYLDTLTTSNGIVWHCFAEEEFLGYWAITNDN